ncbi:hemerythrin domain-containing protein [Azospirillum halopraeferens]|uniref:hemerythrin domain-containing protein n=1 Tax=Azospirillum halopraeferens TaxID=34010 RepID=UPI0004032476|nr:hemerythrin domain-containing protein [Azospirillum halopraeferens]
MSITQVLQSMPAKANELFAKLADTSDGAVKTRERLLGELKEELEQQARLEEEHLFPLLRRHKETKDLVPAAIDDNRKVRALLSELEGMPRDGAAFGDKVGELRRLFQQHVRDEKKELLPAVRKALSDDEQQRLAESLEEQKAGMVEARRAEAEQARRQREAAEATAETARNAARTTAETARNAAQTTAETARSTAQAGAEVARTAARSGVDAARTGARTALQAAGAMDRMAEPVRDRMLAISTAPNVAARAASEAGAAWIAYVNRTALAGSEAGRRLTRCTSPQELAAVQGEVVGEAMNAWLDMQNRLLDISMRASRDMVQRVERAERS